MKDSLSKSEINFWIPIIVVLFAIVGTFMNLKVEVAEAKKDIATIMREVGEIKTSLGSRLVMKEAGK